MEIHFFHVIFLVCFVCSVSGEPWVVIIEASRFWFNTRHTKNCVLLYDRVRTAGIPDDHIILFLALESSCDPRNVNRGKDVYSAAYRSLQVSTDTILHVLKGDMPPTIPPTRLLHSTENDSVFIFLTGHGGDGFLKIHDYEVITSDEISNAVEVMYRRKRYKQLFMVADTCQADSLFKKIRSPRVVTLASTQVGEDALSSGMNENTAVAMQERFSNLLFNQILRKKSAYDWPLNRLMKYINQNVEYLQSTPSLRVFSWPDAESTVTLGEFLTWPRDSKMEHTTHINSLLTFLEEMENDDDYANEYVSYAASST